MASPASTYSTEVICRLLLSRARLVGTVEASFRRNVAQHDDRPGQSAAFVVSGRRAEPVVARAVEVESGPSFRMVDQPDELPVAIARQQRTMGVQDRKSVV